MMEAKHPAILGFAGIPSTDLSTGRDSLSHGSTACSSSQQSRVAEGSAEQALVMPQGCGQAATYSAFVVGMDSS